MTGFTDPDAGRDVARYLGLTMRETGTRQSGTATVEGTVDAAAHLVDAHGRVSAGVLLALADSVAGLGGGLAALPGWVVSTNLLLHAVPRVVVGPLGLRSDVWRSGRRAVVTGISVVDLGADRALLADGVLTSAVLAPEGGPPVYERPLVLTFPGLSGAPSPEEFLGTRALDSERLAIDLVDSLRNPWGILHGGATAMLVDLAGRHATGGDVTTDVVLHYLRPGRVGPVVASVTRVGERPDGTLCRIEVRDGGAEDRLMALAVTTVGS